MASLHSFPPSDGLRAAAGTATEPSATTAFPICAPASVGETEIGGQAPSSSGMTSAGPAGRKAVSLNGTRRCQSCKFFCSGSLGARPADPGRRKLVHEHPGIAAPQDASVAAGGWCGALTLRIPASTARKVLDVLRTRPSVLHLDELINKKDPLQVEFVLQQLRDIRPPVQVAFMQGAVPLEQSAIFGLLLEVLHTCPIWSINLGELRLSYDQCKQLAQCLRGSGVTHMFYECTVAGDWKGVFRSIIRENRVKHGRWRFSPNCAQNQVVLASVKNWFCASSHMCNKRWAARNSAGWSGVDRVQCEACNRWRRLPEGVDSWPHEFYCQLNTWDRRFASCAAPEESWARELPASGDRVACKLSLFDWRKGQVLGVPTIAQWRRGRGRDHSAKDESIPSDGKLTEHELFTIASVAQLPGRRARKQVDKFEAGSCTALSRQLRRAEVDEHARRKLFRVVELDDGTQRCVQFSLDNHRVEWVWQSEWEDMKKQILSSALAQPVEQPASGKSILYKLDGQSWSEVQLLRPVTNTQWIMIKDHLAQHSKQGAATARAAAPEAFSQNASTKSYAKRSCRSQPVSRYEAGRSTEYTRMLRERERQELESRSSWWSARHEDVSLLVRLADETRLHLWTSVEMAPLLSSLPDPNFAAAASATAAGTTHSSSGGGSHGVDAAVPRPPSATHPGQLDVGAEGLETKAAQRQPHAARLSCDSARGRGRGRGRGQGRGRPQRGVRHPSHAPGRGPAVEIGHAPMAASDARGSSAQPAGRRPAARKRKADTDADAGRCLEANGAAEDRPSKCLSDAAALRFE